MEEFRKYNIGLDIGTTSVGWAVTDCDNNVIRIKGKRHLWGVRLFKEANKADKRRTFRSNARRMKRKKGRIKLLQELLEEDISKIDNMFFERLKNSKIWLNDTIEYKKENKSYTRTNKYNLFNELNLNDKSFYKEYKTIYHLRQKLINSKEKLDIRLVYLAIHHIIKYRGNFLYEGKFDVKDISVLKEKLMEIFKIISNSETPCDEEIINEIFKILKDNTLYKKQQLEKIQEMLNYGKEIKEKFIKVISLIIGLKVDLSKIFKIEKSKDIKLSNEYDEVEIQEILGEYIETFQNIKDIYSWYVLKEILNNTNTISDGMVIKYEKYKNDLEKLKKIYLEDIKDYSLYKKMFKKPKDEKVCNYYNYNLKKINIEDLYKSVKTDIEKYRSIENVKNALQEIEKETFLIRLNTTDNGAIPYQLHQNELEKILENQGKYYQSIQKNTDKILKILSFKIPYYVGPLNNVEGQANNWSIRNEGMKGVKVLPWNFDKVINKEKSANEFIRRMTNKCTYLPKEDVIPKESLLYSEFCVLNELNNIRYNNGIQLSKEEKNIIIEDLFKVKKTITKARLKEKLEKLNNFEIYNITGFQKENEFASSMKAYIDFNKILNPILPKDYKMVEEIIEWITIFEDKDILKEKLEKYKDIFNEEQRTYIVNKLNYSGWSRISKKLLVEVHNVDEYNNKLNVMDILRNTNDNFMKIITRPEYIFKKVIDENMPKIQNTKINNTFYEENIETLFTSPANKRGIWQAILVVDEITRVMKRHPEKIFIEFARSDEESSRTENRKKKIENGYKKLVSEYTEEINNDIKKKISDLKAKIDDRLYLYLMQNGKCMYSGKKLEIDNLELYQIDHIIPQSKIKDDSLDNKVLVISKENQRKLDGYITEETIQSQAVRWKKLLDSGLISQIKYFNLLNNKETDRRIEGFIKRQLVETRQITKNVTNILEKVYKDTEVYAIKAQLTHDFREKYDQFKIRDLNNFHHAKDAYISIVVGDFINRRYPKLLKEFKYSDYIKTFKRYTEEKIKGKDKYGFIISNMGKPVIDKETGEIIDEDQEKQYENNILKQLEIKDYFVTKKLEEKNAKFYKQTIQSKEVTKKSKTPIKIKENLDPLKYGSYTSSVDSYSILIEYIKKGKKERKIIGIPTRVIAKIGKDENLLKDYLEKEYSEYKEIKILRNKILSGQLIIKGNKQYKIVSSNEITMSRELRISKQDEFILYIALNSESIKTKLLLKVYEILRDDINLEIEKDYELIKKYLNKIQEQENVEELKSEYIKTRKTFAKYIQEISLNYMYDVLSLKIKEEYFDTVGEKLIELYKEKFISLDVEGKVKLIKLLLTITKGIAIDLKAIGGQSGQGRKNMQNMNTKWLSDVMFVDQSITGIFEKKGDK